MSDSPLVAPTAERERWPVLDILRGFALLGIFLMNIEFFSRPLQTYAQGVPPGEGLDHALGVGIYVLVQGKFWVLFALLFGMGFALMRDRAAAAGRPFLGLYLRRSLLLGAFGLLHVTLLWVGDILVAYSLSALLLLALLKLRGWPALALGLLLYGGMAAFMLLGGIGVMFMPPSMVADVLAQLSDLVGNASAAEAIYANGGFIAITQQRLADFRVLLSEAIVYQLPMMLGVFLIGGWLVGTGKLAAPTAHRRFFVLLAVFGLVLGALGLAAALAFGTHFDLATQLGESTLAMALMSCASLPLSLGYLGLVVLLATGPMQRFFALLAPAGRMALTNYLLQSVVGSLVFYGYGLGLYGDVGRTGQVLLVFGVFIAQVAFSHWWLARFRFGPLEALWRAGTYLRWPAMRHDGRA